MMHELRVSESGARVGHGLWGLTHQMVRVGHE